MTGLNEVFRRAQALGEALSDTREYLDMREAEEAANADPAVSGMFSRLNASRLALTSLMESPDSDSGAVRLVAGRVEELQNTLAALPLVTRRQETREAFAGLVRQVNQTLSFIVSGDTTGGGAASCAGRAGGCAGCAGCGAARD
ncbi:MAG: YlbF family regulator [Oscillospiraceae bacterium]|nr:YlbF family regulator [Oscillospiraceae bacterium]